MFFKQENTWKQTCNITREKIGINQGTFRRKGKLMALLNFWDCSMEEVNWDLFEMVSPVNCIVTKAA